MVCVFASVNLVEVAKSPMHPSDAYGAFEIGRGQATQGFLLSLVR